MPFRLQLLHELMAQHPERAGRLEVHVRALEAAIEANPPDCLDRVRTLFEVAQVSIGEHLRIDYTNDKFHQRNRELIKALDFSLANHPEGERVGRNLADLLKGMSTMTAALGELSNIRGLRHGGGLDWDTLERRHAAMLGGLADSIISFLFETAWSRSPPEPPAAIAYDEAVEFNDFLDEAFGQIEVADVVFSASQVLFGLRPRRYERVHEEWRTRPENP